MWAIRQTHPSEYSHLWLYRRADKSRKVGWGFYADKGSAIKFSTREEAEVCLDALKELSKIREENGRYPGKFVIEEVD